VSEAAAEAAAVDLTRVTVVLLELLFRFVVSCSPFNPTAASSASLPRLRLERRRTATVVGEWEESE